VRIIQEALANVRKHALVNRARVRLQRDGAWVRVAVEDEGVGWDLPALPSRLHFGLQTMRERAEGLGGRLEIDTAPGRGARVVATLPGGGA
jgi:signal transduction histidine kinase